MEDILNQVKAFADKSHGNQKRKYTGERYIVHPVRVMEICREYSDDIAVLSAALLHDVLEDTTTTKEDIQQFLVGIMPYKTASRTISLVEEMTDIYTKANYPELNRKKRRAREAQRLSETSADSQTIKYADLIDNSTDITENDTDFARVFIFECKDLLKKLTKGNPELYKRALKTVDSCISQVKR